MKFKFCGELDCPDWVLAEIITLSKLTSIKIRQLCGQVAKQMLGTATIDYDKVLKLVADAKLEAEDVKAAVACLQFMVSSAGKHGCPVSTLESELQQLGLPREHCVAVCRVMAEHGDDLRRRFRDDSVRVTPRLAGVEWRVECPLGSHLRPTTDQLPPPSVSVNIALDDKDEICFTADADMLRVLTADLKKVQATMKSLESN